MWAAVVTLALAVAGAAVGLAAVAVHPLWWGLLLATAASVVALLAVPAGLRRVGFAAGWLLPFVLVLSPRPEGDFVVQGSVGGYAFLGLGLVVLSLTIATLPRPGGRQVGADAGGVRR